MKLSTLYTSVNLPYVRLSDTKSSGTAGTSYTSGAYRTVTINTEEQDADALCSLSSNQITLEAGSYQVSIWGQEPINIAVNVGVRLRTTGGVTLLKWPMQNSSRDTNLNVAINTRPVQHSGRFTLASQTTFELQVFPSATWQQSALTDGEGEVYWVIELAKLD
jgi:hypothetical protein